MQNVKIRESNHDDGDCDDYTLQKCSSLNKSNTEENSTSILATLCGWTLFCLQNFSASILPAENEH